MRLVIQRVKNASVSVKNETISSINKGLLVLLGVHIDDTPELTPRLVKKLLNLRIFEDDEGKMNLNVQQIGGEVMVISQFTLLANTNGGNRPSFTEAARPETAEPIYKKFANEVKDALGDVQTGVFGAEMAVELINDGPVTLIIN
jgi:D-tyrosyl-tRNA(Tyr) deacylase